MPRLSLPHDSFRGTIAAACGLAVVIAVALQGVRGGLPDWETIDGLARLAHVFALILWMGHNYANVITRPSFRGPPPMAPAEELTASFLAASQREHAMFRYPSLVVWASGLYMLWYRGLLPDALLLREPALTIGLGAWLGTAMVLNLWLVMWPHQKKVLGFVPASLPERARCARVTYLSSRTNTILSVPTVLLMVAGAHGAPLAS